MAEDGTEQTQAQVAPRSTYAGRRQLVCSATEVTAENVAGLVERARLTHCVNSAEISYLHGYFLGRQPVTGREKAVRPEINNRVTENRAYQMAKDRADSLAGEPITYSAHASGRARGGTPEETRSASDELSTKVQRLNDFCDAAEKHACDLELVQWMCEVGVGYRLVLPRMGADGGVDDESPFVMRSLDPRYTFVVHRNDVMREPLFAVVEVTDEETGDVVDTVYTDGSRFVVRNAALESSEENPMGMLPVVEYDANPERMGVFEAVLSMFDAINEVESDRVDGVEQFIQALMVLENVDMDSEEFREMQRMGAVKVSSTGDKPSKLYFINAELNQDQVQTLVDHLYRTACSICGMPINLGGGASTSDTGAAVTMRDGWSNSENRCKETEAMFRRAERRFLAAALSICDRHGGLGLRPGDVEVKFTRRNYEAIQSKAQVLTTMLGSDKVHPRLAFEHCGMFSDPEAAYDLSQGYVDERGKQAERIAGGADDQAQPDEERGAPPAGGDTSAGPGVTGAKQAEATRVTKA